MLEFLRRLFGGRPTPLLGGIRLVSEALQIEASDEHLQEAIAAIDAVHQDGNLPRIRVVRALLTNKHGQFAILDTGEPVIRVSYFTHHAGLTAVHEVGHFLDYSGIGQPEELASLTSPALADWRRAMRESQAIQRLEPLLQIGSSKATETLPGGTVVEYDVDPVYLRYLLTPQELWARSYAQFIATRSGNADLRLQLDKIRERPARAFYYGEQWGDVDFRPIMAELEALFRQLGWL